MALEPLAGGYTWGANVKIEYFDQELAGLNPRASVIEEIAVAAPRVSEGELRNYLERALLLRDEPSLAALAEGAPATTRGCGYAAAKEQTLARFERDYVAKLLADHGGKVAPAASSAGLTREHVYRLMRKHGISLRS